MLEPIGANVCQPEWLEPIGAICAPARVLKPSGAICVPARVLEPSRGYVCQTKLLEPFGAMCVSAREWLVPRRGGGGLYVSARVAGAQQSHLCVSQGGCSPEWVVCLPARAA